MTKFFAGRKIVVTGCCGTIGSALVRSLVGLEDNGPASIVGLDNAESALFFMSHAFQAHQKVDFFVSDIRDQADLCQRFKGADMVFHCAAFKHVMLSELSPEQTIQNNVIGTQNVIFAASQNDVERVIFTSSDKAVNPTNVMGTSKLLGERLMSAANSNSVSTIFASTRFGNVLGSNGSVVEIFERQITEGRKLTITDAEMTRFVMSTSEAVHLVINSAEFAVGGEVFITKMAAIKIIDLATAMLEMSGRDKIDFVSDMEIIGAKPGEKLYEELMTSEETRRAIELKDYFCVRPAFSSKPDIDSQAYGDLVNSKVSKPYVSEDEPKLSVDDIKTLLSILSS